MPATTSVRFTAGHIGRAPLVATKEHWRGRRCRALPTPSVGARRTDNLLVGAIARDRLTPLDLAVAAGPVLCTHGQLLRRSHTFFRPLLGTRPLLRKLMIDSWVCAGGLWAMLTKWA